MKEKLQGMSNLQQRVIAAVIAIPFLLFCIIYSDWTFYVLFALISVLAQLEFYKLLGLDGNEPLTYYGTFCGFILVTVTFLIEKGIIPYEDYYVLSPLMALIFFIKLYKSEDEKPFKNIAYTFLGVIYVALPFALIIILAFLTPDFRFSWQRPLGCLFLLWPVIQVRILQVQNLVKQNCSKEFHLKNHGRGVSVVLLPLCWFPLF
jgi:phosphatidate cytidylyltransferase